MTETYIKVRDESQTFLARVLKGLRIGDFRSTVSSFYTKEKVLRTSVISKSSVRKNSV